jgi:hypothetical protein
MQREVLRKIPGLSLGKDRSRAVTAEQTENHASVVNARYNQLPRLAHFHDAPRLPGNIQLLTRP